SASADIGERTVRTQRSRCCPHASARRAPDTLGKTSRDIRRAPSADGWRSRLPRRCTGTRTIQTSRPPRRPAELLEAGGLQNTDRGARSAAAAAQCHRAERAYRQDSGKYGGLELWCVVSL